MKHKLCLINAGKYTPFILDALRPEDWDITEWDIIPLTGDYDLVLFFLEDVKTDDDITSLRTIKTMFLDYVERHPAKWVMFAPQENVRIRRRGVMKNFNRCILDACKFGYGFKKRFRAWSSFPIESVLCSKNCMSARSSCLHDPADWEKENGSPMKNRHIQLMKRYDELNQIPTKLIHHIIEIALSSQNHLEEIDDPSSTIGQ